ncbi:unnamed protein product [Calypogeia fissa]
MSCRMACAVCEEPYELQKTDYTTAATLDIFDIGQEIRLKSGESLPPIIKGDLIVTLWDTRTTPGPDYILKRPLYRNTVEELRTECCDKKK